VTLEEYEALAARTINPALDERGRLLDAAMGLAEEAGEILGVVRKDHFVGRPLDPDQLRVELGDALWCLAMTARAAGLTLEEIAQANLTKLEARHPDGFRADGDAGQRRMP
jgi:NTP pyrophosphatase (non-canonical NTP hydrolase)